VAFIATLSAAVMVDGAVTAAWNHLAALRALPTWRRGRWKEILRCRILIALRSAGNDLNLNDRITRGERVILMVALANRDPSQSFDDPDRFEPHVTVAGFSLVLARIPALVGSLIANGGRGKPRARSRPDLSEARDPGLDRMARRIGPSARRHSYG